MPPKKKVSVTDSKDSQDTDDTQKPAKDEEEPSQNTRSTRSKAGDKKDQKEADKQQVTQTKDQSSSQQDSQKQQQSTKRDSQKDDAKQDDSKQDDSKQDVSDDQDKKQPEQTKDKVKKQETKEEQLTFVGQAPVDKFCPRKDLTVFFEGDQIYDTQLNQSDVQNNNNKFYIAQLLQTEKDEYFLWTRWGRVGVDGQNALIGPDSKAGGIHSYEQKVRDKISGGYTQVEIDYGEDQEGDADEENSQQKGEDLEKKKEKDEKGSQLPQQVKDLVNLIFDMKMMNAHLKEIGYDAQKMPLGKLQRQTIDRGYSILNDISNQLNGKKKMDKLNDLSSEFYSNIPHDFGFKRMENFVIKDQKTVKEKLELLDSLRDMQIAKKILENVKQDQNLFDQNYAKLNCEINPIDQKSKTFQLIETFVRNTHAKTHTQYKLKVQQAYELDQAGEDARYKKDLHNKMMLWHGSRLTNFVGILSQGLRIAPPQAPVTGYMFGKGVYFADMVSKSANYCFTTRENNTGLILICEVALGNMNDQFYADYYASNLPPGKHSTRGCGKTAPPQSSYLDVDGVQWPIGQGQPAKIEQGSLLYNEFIVYSLDQIKLKYLIRLKFEYN